jgi:hypothetical protein
LCVAAGFKNQVSVGGLPLKLSAEEVTLALTTGAASMQVTMFKSAFKTQRLLFTWMLSAEEVTLALTAGHPAVRPASSLTVLLQVSESIGCSGLQQAVGHCPSSCQQRKTQWH